MKISIALCTYNGQKYIAEQLQSLINQTRLPDELIVVDDGSSDQTVQLVKSFSNHAPLSVTLIENEEPLGASQNFSKALGHCTGDLIFPCDQDDLWQKDKIAVLEKIFQQNPDCLLAFSDLQMIKQDGSIIQQRTLWSDLAFTQKDKQHINSQKAFRHLIRRNMISGNAMAFRSELLSKALPIPSMYMHDEWIALIASMIGSLCSTDQLLVHYRLHEEQVVSSPSGLMEQWKYAKKIMNRSYFRNRATRANALVDAANRLQDILLDVTITDFIHGHMIHSKAITTIHEHRLTRPFLILRELIQGRYHKYDYGLKGVIRDVFL